MLKDTVIAHSFKTESLQDIIALISCHFIPFTLTEIHQFLKHNRKVINTSYIDSSLRKYWPGIFENDEGNTFRDFISEETGKLNKLNKQYAVLKIWEHDGTLPRGMKVGFDTMSKGIVHYNLKLPRKTREDILNYISDSGLTPFDVLKNEYSTDLNKYFPAPIFKSKVINQSNWDIEVSIKMSQVSLDAVSYNMMMAVAQGDDIETARWR